MISLSCQTVRTLNFEIAYTSGCFGYSKKVGRDNAWPPLVFCLICFTQLAKHLTTQKTKETCFVESGTFGSSFRKVCNFQSVVSLRQIGTFSFNFSHQKQNVRKYWSPMALHCFFSIFSRDFQLLRPFFSKTLGSKKVKKHLVII